MMRRINSSCQAPSRCCRRPSRSTATPASARHNTFPDNLKAVDVQQPAVILQQGACRPDQHDNQQHEERLRISSASSATTEHQQQVEALQRVLQVPFHRAELIAHQTPTVLTFEPQTLRITIDTLCEVLHLNYHTVVAIVQQRPGILQSPDEPVMVQQQLSVLLGVTCWRMANLLGTKYADLLALTPQVMQKPDVYYHIFGSLLHCVKYVTYNMQPMSGPGAATGVHMVFTKHVAAVQLAL